MGCLQSPLSFLAVPLDGHYSRILFAQRSILIWVLRQHWVLRELLRHHWMLGTIRREAYGRMLLSISCRSGSGGSGSRGSGSTLMKSPTEGFVLDQQFNKRSTQHLLLGNILRAIALRHAQWDWHEHPWRALLWHVLSWHSHRSGFVHRLCVFRAIGTHRESTLSTRGID
jgi:hypothetical protein